MKLLSGLGTHSRPATTSSPLAKKYFDQGLILAFAFKFDDAMLSFTEATRLDPDFALAWWGIALCNGPHVHAPLVPPDQSKAAWDAILRALSLRYRTSPVEKDLIDALAARCSAPNAPGGAPGSGGVDRGTLDRAYAKEMKRLSITYPDDADVATLYAGSLLELVRWETYAPDGTPREQTPDIAKALDRALALDPAHPGANHLTIHAYEASPHPEKAAVAAQRLGLMVPCVCVPTLEAGQ